jgi:UDP-2,4-diacetamido-2,4,6-trideoxy-beta-L-altropyranose hydrolase
MAGSSGLTKAFMEVAFRVDASLQIGAGHVMRCLTLADALKTRGARCRFISRAHPGHLIELILERGYEVNSLPTSVRQAQEAIEIVAKLENSPQGEPTHATWLGSTWQADAEETAAILSTCQPDWLVLDHYALDLRWEAALVPHYRKLLVIDDLADRSHCCDMLLDQNLGRQAQDYAALVDARCQLLVGPQYALLRPEFAALRGYSLQRRHAQHSIRRLLISMGGVDQYNATGQVMQALKTCSLPVDCHITVVMGLTAPWLQNVQELAAQMPWTTEVLVNVKDMAQLMASSDLAIGAAGSTSWERCCLGVPTLMVVLAENQCGIASALSNAGAALAMDARKGDQFSVMLIKTVAHLVNDEAALSLLSHAALKVTNGYGSILVAAQMVGEYAI